MPVTVQLPGGPREAPIHGLAQVASLIGNMYHQSKANDLAQQKNELAQQEFESKEPILEAQAAQAQRENQNAEQQQKALSDPASFASQNKRAQAEGLLQTFRKNKIIDDPTYSDLHNSIFNNTSSEGPVMPMSGIAVEQTMSGPLSKAMEDANKSQVAATAAGNKLIGLVDTKNNSLADSIVQHFNGDKVISKYTLQRDQIATDLHTLRSGAPITATLKAEVEKGLANALSGGSSSGLGQTEKVEFKNIFTDAAKLGSYWTGAQQEADPPGYRQYLIDTLDRLDKAAELNQWSQAQRIAQQKNGIYKNNPQAAQALKQSAESYRPGWFGHSLGNDTHEAPPTTGAGGKGPGGAMSFADFMATRKK